MTVQPLDAHPVPAGVTELHRVLDAMPTEAWAALDDATVRRTTADLARVQARLDAHRMAAARRLEKTGAAKRAGATSTGDLLSRDFGGDRAGGDRTVRTAQALARTTRTEGELQAGHVSLDQARVIAEGMGRLPHAATDDQRDLVERSLLKSAQTLSLKDLRRRTDRAVDAYATRDETDRVENQTLEQRERHARGQSTFSLWDRRDGTWEGRFVLPEAPAQMLKAAVESIAAPARAHLQRQDSPEPVTDPLERMDHPHRMGQGLLELCLNLPTDHLPSAGGVGALLTVNLDLETLLKGVRPATLSTGTRISAGQVRRMSCHLGLLPMVFGGGALPLDFGLTRRLFSPAQRRAMERRDGGCTFPGCDRPPAWCQAHHLITAWADGGTTDLANGALLCALHHHHVHDRHWQGRVNPADGHVEYRPPGGVWRRNHRWRP